MDVAVGVAVGVEVAVGVIVNVAVSLGVAVGPAGVLVLSTKSIASVGRGVLVPGKVICNALKSACESLGSNARMLMVNRNIARMFRGFRMDPHYLSFSSARHLCNASHGAQV
ncbi:MAG: hypothetical protein D6737_06420 [Chloroflexi bacterium]|nr:MAG: hypothetical protein D6737_06420 [Chloroflexota bacterium]